MFQYVEARILVLSLRPQFKSAASGSLRISVGVHGAGGLGCCEECLAGWLRFPAQCPVLGDLYGSCVLKLQSRSYRPMQANSAGPGDFSVKGLSDKSVAKRHPPRLSVDHDAAA